MMAAAPGGYQNEKNPSCCDLGDDDHRPVSRADPIESAPGTVHRPAERFGTWRAIGKCSSGPSPRTRARTWTLIITPECFLDGYVVIAKDWNPQRFLAMGQDVNTSPYILRLRALAAKYKVYIVFGFTENAGGKLYDAAIMVDRTGATVGIYHKTMLQAEDLRFSPGQELPVFNTEWGKMGILICADRRWPESARVERLKGARITLIPSYGNWGLANQWWMRTRSYENGFFIAFTHPR